MKLKAYAPKVAVILFPIVGLLTGCGKPQLVVPPSLSSAKVTASSTVNLKPIEVTLRFTGMVHLVGSAADQRLVVVPKVSGHTFLLTTLASNDTELLPDTGTIKIGTEETHVKYRVFPSGYEIDLAESGWIESGTPKLDFTEAGDENNPPNSKNAECPDGNAPAKSLHWLPSLSAASKTPVKIKLDFQQKDPPASKIHTRLEITEGRVEAALPLEPSRFEFDRNGKIDQNDGDHIQAMANSLDFVYTAYVDPNKPYYVLKGRKFRSKPADADQWAELVRIKPASDKVVLTFANVVKNDFFNPKSPTQIVHFHHYYEITDTKYDAKKEKVVALQNNCPKSPSGGESGVECGPVRVKGTP